MVSIQVQGVTFKKISAVIFDKDGTLENSENLLRNLAQKRSRLIDAQIPGVGDPLLMAFGVEGDRLDPAGLMAVGSRRENEIAAAAYIAETGRGWLESLEIAGRAFDEADQYFKDAPPSPLFAGSLEVLKFLAEVGLKLAILSAASQRAVEAFVERYQLGDYVQVQMGVDEGLSKPDPALYCQACKNLDVQPSNTLMVGDAAVDMEMAKQAGAAGCIGISWKPQSAVNLYRADVIITQLDEIQVLQTTDDSE
ncbi:HAD family hydrolase [Capilliphycus salinus ALCB114379]|uniref:HAD family hydrolase n=1 Tax=Capilliphycus salinus TaxID=2768948 RepID=UPI0039A42773